MRLLAPAPPAAPLPRRSEAEAFWNSFNSGRRPQRLSQFQLSFFRRRVGTPPLQRKSLAAARSLEGGMELGPAAVRLVPVLEQCTHLGISLAASSEGSEGVTDCLQACPPLAKESYAN